MKRFRVGVFSAWLAAAIVLALVPKVLALFSGVPPTVTAASASAKSDLRNIAAAQEAFRADSGRYAARVSPAIYRLSSGVTGPAITLTADGYVARVGYRGTAMECAIFAGSVPGAPATEPGVPACVGVPRRGPGVWGYAYYLLPLLLVVVGWRRARIPG